MVDLKKKAGPGLPQTKSDTEVNNMTIVRYCDYVPMLFVDHKEISVMQLVCRDNEDISNTAVVTAATAADDHDDASKSNALNQNVWLLTAQELKFIQSCTDCGFWPAHFSGLNANFISTPHYRMVLYHSHFHYR